MSMKELQTRIALKYDSFENWTNTAVVGKGGNLVLLAGELGICEVPTANSDSHVAPTVLFKVGGARYPEGHDKAGQLMAFKDLPWASARAADVYSWAKSETVVLTETTTNVETGEKKQYIQFKTGDTVNHAIDLSMFATEAELKDTTDRLKAIEDALGFDGTDTDGSVTAQIVNINNRLNEIIGTDTKTGLIDAAEDRIEAKLGGNFGTAEGQKTVTKTIEDAQAAAEQYTVDAIKALSEKDGVIFELDERVDAIEDKLEGIGDKTVSDYVADAINNLDSTDAGDTTLNSIVKSVSQADGKVTVTYGKLTRDELPDLVEDDIPEIHANKVVVADATTDGEGNSVAKVTLDAKLTAIDGEINSIRDSIAGGVHFIGIIPVADGEDAGLDLNNATVIIDGKSITAEAGDVVIKGTQEYIYNGTAWEPLGDITRIGAVESRVDDIEDIIAAMDAALDADANEFVTGIVQVDGKITKIDTARPTAENVEYGKDAKQNSITVKAKLDELSGEIDAVEDRADKLEAKVNLAEGETITGKITDAINNLNLADNQATGDGNFVVSVTQTNGQLAVEKGTLPEASATTKGIVTLGASGGAATYDVVNELSQKVDGLENNTIPAITDRLDNIEEEYVRIDGDKLVMGKTGTQLIIFDCGSATEATEAPEGI